MKPCISKNRYAKLNTSFHNNIIPINCVSNKKTVNDEDKHQRKTPGMLKSLSDTTTLLNTRSQLKMGFYKAEISDLHYASRHIITKRPCKKYIY